MFKIKVSTVDGKDVRSCKSRTNINNYEEPVYAVILEDGPTSTYGESATIKYIPVEGMPVFYKLLPELARYYKVTIRVVENPDKLPF